MHFILTEAIYHWSDLLGQDDKYILYIYYIYIYISHLTVSINPGNEKLKVKFVLYKKCMKNKKKVS